jgi:hypothetical protein
MLPMNSTSLELQLVIKCVIELAVSVLSHSNFLTVTLLKLARIFLNIAVKFSEI